MRNTLHRVLAIALFAAATVGPLGSAVIETSADCSLFDAILSANQNGPQGGCNAGDPGLDKIVMTQDETITLPYDADEVVLPIRIRDPEM